MTPEAKAARARKKMLAKLFSAVSDCYLIDDQIFFSANGVTIESNIDNMVEFNNVLEKIGYRPVRITHNMLNKAAGNFIIDADTPYYCDPASESYHSR